ncbi:type III secretion system chaperone family protein [Bosea sp. (in: a-proteobacteria)]|uniref:YbjN domain-containing protein n=1 Tax=Bosea sp. (in: a-proteobacteria) TaxID=1871050 RepID=UPI00333EC4C9
MMDLDMDADFDRPSNPLDLFERLASLNDWTFDRDSEDELSVSVTGGWSEYHVAITWLAEVEALHIACAFDLKVPERRRGEVLQLVGLVNEQLWLGHFDLWSSEGVVMYRHALLLSGGAEATDEQAAALIKSAIDACERYYQAFQFVVWAGKTAKEGLEGAMLETAGEA